ncbi:hypothetical protein [uncultured Halomonas sp.]|uniref:hypothetical protein n=1 Tax=uncultured Halomonas sp. TaxID=173971 RepID=UPI00262BF327|nr:hypothetical protein [uncultured Halomonas sp.]
MSPTVIESRAQHRAKAIITGPEKPIITDRRDKWRYRLAWHRVTGQTHPLKIWRA